MTKNIVYDINDVWFNADGQQRVEAASGREDEIDKIGVTMRNGETDFTIEYWIEGWASWEI